MTGDDPGPLVRLYGLTGGRARPAGESFDLVAIVTTTAAATAVVAAAAAGAPAVTAAGAPAEPSGLVPEHLAALALCRRPTPVADVAAHLRLPLNVTRVLLGDLRHQGLVTIDRPRPAAQTIDENIYREVLHGLRRL